MRTRFAAAAAQIPASNTTLYTVPSDCANAIVRSGVCNNITTNTTLTLYVVPQGSVASSSNQYITTRTVSAATPLMMDEITGMILETGDTIVVVAADASRLNMRVGILEIVEN